MAWCFAAGAGLGAASLVKQVAAAPLLLYALFLLASRGRRPIDRLADLTALVGGFAMAWGLALGALAYQGTLSLAFDDFIRYGGALATDAPPEPNAPMFLVRWFTGNADPRGVLPWPFGTTTYLVWWGTGSWPLWLAAVPAVAWLGLGPTDARRRLIAAWTLMAWVEVALPRLFWQHYYLLPIPGVALVVALVAADAALGARAAFGRKGFGRAFVWAVVLLISISAVIGAAVIQVRDYLLVAPEQLTARYKGGLQWIDDRALGRELARRTTGWADPSLFIWGWQSPLLLYSGLDSPTPHFFTDNLLRDFADKDHPVVRPRIERIVRDLRARPPALIFAGYTPFPSLAQILRERYRPSRLTGPPLPGGLGLWVERSRYAEFEAGARSRRPSPAAAPSTIRK